MIDRIVVGARRFAPVTPALPCPALPCEANVGLSRANVLSSSAIIPTLDHLPPFSFFFCHRDPHSSFFFES